MPLPTLPVKNGAGADAVINTPNSGRQNAADAQSVVWSNEDLAAIGAITEAAPASDTAASGLNGRLQRIAQRLTTLLGAAGDTPPALATNASGLVGWLRALVDRTPAVGRAVAAASSPVVMPQADVDNLAGAATIFAETTTALGSNGTYTGNARDMGAPSSGNQLWAYFNAWVIADQTGSAFIEQSVDGATGWSIVASAPIAVNTPLILSVPVFRRYSRLRIANNATAQTSLAAASSYTAA